MNKNKTKSLIIACVNYNTFDKLYLYLNSIEKARGFCNNDFNVTVLIADNSEVSTKSKLPFFENINIVYCLNNKNQGYIGGIRDAVINLKINIYNTDYFIISNVDVILTNGFFNELFLITNNNNLGWIAPSIISEKEGRDRNPKIKKRPSSGNLKKLLVMYKYPILHLIYKNTIYKYKSKKISKYKNDSIYAGHGSFMIFTKKAVNSNGFLDFPSFLFGEEIYFGELMKSENLEVVYYQNIVVKDFDHASTSLIRKSKYYKMNYDSLKIIIKNYFEE
jgi:GT2 family glycosyltransferase